MTIIFKYKFGILFLLNLSILNEITTNGMDYNILTGISLISILFGIFVIVSRNPILSVLFLIMLFISVAGYLMMLGINFIGLSYLLVYVGAVSILFLFILMLINVRVSELVTENNNSVPLAVIITMLVGVNILFPSITNMPNMMVKGGDSGIYGGIESNIDNTLMAVSSSWDGKLVEFFHITTIGNVIYTNYPVWLILISIILLLAMIGSILITIKQ